MAQALKARVEALTTTVVALSAAAAAGTSDATATTSDYVLPVASVSQLGGIRVDGTTVTVTASVLSATAGALPATTPPVMDGVAAVGASTHYARADHVHPHDTSNPENYQTGAQMSTALTLKASRRTTADATETAARIAADAAESSARLAGDLANRPHELVVTGAVPVELVCTILGEPIYVRV